MPTTGGRLRMIAACTDNDVMSLFTNAPPLLLLLCVVLVMLCCYARERPPARCKMISFPTHGYARALMLALYVSPPVTFQLRTPHARNPIMTPYCNVYSSGLPYASLAHDTHQNVCVKSPRTRRPHRTD